jgi:hypothetical protein
MYLTPCNSDFPEKLIVAQLVEIFGIFYGTSTFIPQLVKWIPVHLPPILYFEIDSNILPFMPMLFEWSLSFRLFPQKMFMQCNRT